MKAEIRKRGELEHEGVALANIHRKANQRKAAAYWLGFLRGVLASSRVETREMGPLRIEAEQFLTLLHDEDAAELIRDLDTAWDDTSAEIYSVIECIVGVRSREFVIETDKDEVNEFYGFCAGIACDNVITPHEVEKLIDRVWRSDILLDDRRVASMAKTVSFAIADGRITPDESEDICDWITRLVGDSAADTGVATFGNVGVIDGALDDPAEVVFEGRMFVLTGKFAIGPRKAVARMIAERGGGWKNAVCRKTDYLAVAASASRDWRHTHEGLKIMRAMKLRGKGGRPHMVQEPTLAVALG
ncbi:MAG TPA: hypothetical protein ENH55_06840 [Aurantimonas coralicida]|uniref:BRCT domain-containing protein n=2 Tax=root TaxID=1 RepID=A0A9C9ND02_9HYPH|nr:hypothetical protein [Aurantimonas coralicida]HET99764.1 hypothetical protein [Aurantimonas coralicida]